MALCSIIYVTIYSILFHAPPMLQTQHLASKGEPGHTQMLRIVLGCVFGSGFFLSPFALYLQQFGTRICHFAGTCCILAWSNCVFHGIFYMLALLLCMVHGICYIWPRLPSILHGSCYVFALQPFICMVLATFCYFKRSVLRVSLGLHLGFI